MLTNRNTKPIIGDCEVKDGHTNIEVWLEDGNIYMCAECRAEQRKLAERYQAATKLVDSFRESSASIQVEQDIWNSETIPMIEVRAAIEQDDTIPADKKEETFTAECLKHRNHLDEVIFGQMEELKKLQNQRNAWHTNGQLSAGKLRGEAREKYRMFDVNYQPAVIKTIKPPKTKTPTKSPRVLAQEAREVAKKYDLDATVLQMIAKAHHLSLEGAAQFMLKQLQ